MSNVNVPEVLRKLKRMPGLVINLDGESITRFNIIEMERVMVELIAAVDARLQLAKAFDPRKKERQRLAEVIGGFDPSSIPTVRQLRLKANDRVRHALADAMGCWP